MSSSSVSDGPVFAGLTPDDLAAIRAATEAAEARTGGELVCVLVKQCDSYPGGPWKGAAFGAIAAAAAVGLWQVVGLGWQPIDPYLLPLATLLGAAAGFLAVLALPTLRRLLVPAEVLDLRVDRRAAAAFLAEEIFATRERTGVLLFVAFFEHRVRILADSGIHERVDAGVWDSIAGDLTRGIRAGRARESLIAALDTCGRVLEERGIERRADDLNELDDEPRLLDD